jgi:nucleosome assembly protein 1-like 1
LITAASSSGAVKGVPGFWLQCIANHPTVSTLLGEQDGPALQALTDIKLEYSEDYSSFKLLFHFAPNDYFTNEILTKSYTVSPDLLEETAPALTSVEGTEIQWKEKKNLCEVETKKKQKSKKGGQTRFVTQKVPKESFFHYFGDPHMGDDDEEEDDDEAGAEAGAQKHEFQLSVDEDYEIGHAIRSEIFPSAILWFTGEADGGMGLDDDEDDEDDDEEDEDEEEDDEDEDPAEESEEVDASKGKSRKGKGPSATQGAGAAGAAGEQPECKQS